MEMPSHKSKPLSVYSIGQRCCIKPWQRLQYWTFESDTRLETAWVFEIFSKSFRLEHKEREAG